ncbi:MAG TPA: DUF3667 domain-containing protein [Chryseosolibacter sp.]
MSHKRYRSDNQCLNCGSIVNEHFCGTCGQENLELKENFFHMVVHVVGDFFHFDSKFFRSIIPLFTKPGFLTKQYIEGRRVSYIHPLRLFFFVTIMTVLVASAYYKKFEKDLADETTIVTDDAGNPQKLSEAEKKKILSEKELKEVNDIKVAFGHFFYQFKYISFFLLPLYAFGFKLLYRRLYYMDHLTYTMHVQSFIYIILSIVWLINIAAPATRPFLSDIVLLAIIIYVLLSLKYVHQQSWLKTIAKSIIAFFWTMFVTLMVFALVVVISVSIAT